MVVLVGCGLWKFDALPGASSAQRVEPQVHGQGYFERCETVIFDVFSH